MKTVLVSTLAAAAVALSMSSAFAFSNSPQGAVINGGGAAPVTSYFEGNGYDREAAPAPRARFLSGQVYDEGDQPNQYFGLSSNAIQGREFHAVQQGGHWFHEGGE